MYQAYTAFALWSSFSNFGTGGCWGFVRANDGTVAVMIEDTLMINYR